MKCSAVIPILVVLCSLIFQAHAAPADMTVSGEERERERLSNKFINAPSSPKEQQVKEIIKKLETPLRRGGEVTITYRSRTGTATHQGKIHNVYNGRANIGNRQIDVKLMSEVDRLLFEKYFPKRGERKPKVDPVKEKIADYKAQLKKERDRSIALKVDAAMQLLGYDHEFFNQVVIIGDQYVPREEIHQKKNFALRIVEYGKGAGIKQNVLDLELVNNRQMRTAAVLVVEDPKHPGEFIPLISSKSSAGDNAVTERGWANAKAQINTKDFPIIGKDLAKLIRTNSRLLLMKRDLLVWDYKCVATSGGKAKNSNILECRSCLGSKVVAPISGVDVSQDAEALLRESAAGAAYRVAVMDLVAECSKPQEGGRSQECPTCKGTGLETVGRYSSRTSIINYDMNLPVRALPEMGEPMNSTCPRLPVIDNAQIRDFEVLFNDVPNQDSIVKAQMSKATEYGAKRREMIRSEYLQKIEKVLESFLSERKIRMHNLLESRFGWLTAKQMKQERTDKSPGAQKVILASGEDDGYLPTVALGKPVRRYTEWEKLNTRPDTQLGGYSLMTTYYRMLEVGGTPITEAQQAAPASDKKGFRGQPNKSEKAETNQNQGVPSDLLQRGYIIQIAISFRSSISKGYTVGVSGDVEFTPNIDPDQKINFPLDEKTKAIQLRHSFRVPANWAGYLIGSTMLTYSQMVADFDRSAFKFKSTIE